MKVKFHVLENKNIQRYLKIVSQQFISMHCFGIVSHGI